MMFRKIVFVLSMVMPLGLQPVVDCQIQIVYTPENTVFVFDFDRVILTMSLGIKYFKRVKTGTQEIIILLKNLGYRIDGGTNNKLKNVKYFQKKFAVFKLFTNIKCIESKKALKKPYDAYFQDYMKRFGDKTKKYYIFVDDMLENVFAARRNGFIGIHFKNAEQLYDDLVEMGIL
jgi:FMN phosphatase YigB (HAD superfamily)